MQTSTQEYEDWKNDRKAQIEYEIWRITQEAREIKEAINQVKSHYQIKITLKEQENDR